MKSSQHKFTTYLVLFAIAPIVAVSAQPTERVLQFTDAVTETWEFGLEIEATGNVRGIVATVPIPVEWPEQSIKIIDSKKSKDVSRVDIKELGGTVKQMTIHIPQLPKGATSRTTVTMEIEKRNIVAPENPDQLIFADTKSRKIRVFLTPSPNIESRHERIVELAEKISIDEDDNAWDQVRTIYDWVQNHIDYKFDPTIRTCIESLDKGQGDCEELSSVFIAICRARGIPARAVWIPGHTYPEFYLADESGTGHWIPCQSAGPKEFGSMTESKPILQKGDKFRIKGHQQQMRYVQPTITATDANAAPKLKWIMEKVK